MSDMMLLLCVLLLLCFCNQSKSVKSVDVYHFIYSSWASQEYTNGPQLCDTVECHWTTFENFSNSESIIRSTNGKDIIQMTVYNIHSWYNATENPGPSRCHLPPLSLAESEESTLRFGPWIFDKTFPNFDGYSTTNPTSHIPRVYAIASNYTKSDLMPGAKFSDMLKAAAYIAGDCHELEKNANSNRDTVVKNIRKLGFRVDGLGKCMHHIGKGGVSIPLSNSTGSREEDYVLKKRAIHQYLFYLAFENTIEPGYVTEKPFHGLIAGTVPVYLGDCEQLRRLLPDPRAAICISDFSSLDRLVSYLQYLSQNETAYEERRSWRLTYDAETHRRQNNLLRTSFQCNVCKWAAAHGDKYSNITRESLCISEQRAHEQRMMERREKEQKAAKKAAEEKQKKELVPAQLYSLLCLLAVFVVVIARLTVRLWCPHWLRTASAIRHN